jgi:hypothetical protein
MQKNNKEGERKRKNTYEHYEIEGEEEFCSISVQEEERS